MPPVFVRFMPILFVILWSTGFIGAGYAMPWAEPFGFLAIRFLIAFVILVALVVVLRRPMLPTRLAFQAMIAGGLIHGTYLGFAFWAIHAGLPAGLCALIVSLQPLIVAIFAGMVLGESVSGRQWMGMALGLIGVATVLAPTLGEVGAGVNVWTVGACVIGLLGISFGTLWQKRFVANADLVTGTMWQYLGATIVTGVPALLFEEHRFIINGELIFAMAWLVLVLSLGAIFLLMAMIRRGEVSKVSSLFYLVPAVTALMAWALFDERLNAIQIVGMAISAAGVALAQKAPRRLASR